MSVYYTIEANGIEIDPCATFEKVKSPQEAYAAFKKMQSICLDYRVTGWAYGRMPSQLYCFPAWPNNFQLSTVAMAIGIDVSDLEIVPRSNEQGGREYVVRSAATVIVPILAGSAAYG